jgi:5'-methylthioadenosine phosphorylase
MNKADIGIFGGSGLYSFLEKVEEVEVDTPYGKPSDKIFMGEHAGKKIAFIPRHGRDHSIPPHKINYRANVWAFKELGCSSVICPCAAGSLQEEYAPGHFAIADQWVDRTNGTRQDTFFEGPEVQHISPAIPYTQSLRELAVEAAKDNDITVHDGGTIVIINGPRFSTQAESKWFHEMGWQIINMTQYPEAYLVKEAGMDVVNISLITDYDSGVHTGTEPVSHEAVLEVFNQNLDNLRKLLFTLIEKIPVKAAA